RFMDNGFYLLLARGILFFHFLVVAFNIFGLIAVPLGGWFKWRFVRVFWWRALHLASLVLVAVQAAFGRLCFLTIWQNWLQQQAGGYAPNWFDTLLNRAIYWPLPLAVFVVLYCVALGLAVAMWFAVKPAGVERRIADAASSG